MPEITIPDHIVATYVNAAPENWVTMALMQGRMQGDSVVDTGIDVVATWDGSSIVFESTSILPAQVEFDEVEPFLDTLPEDWNRLEILISIDGSVTAELTTGPLPPVDFTADDPFHDVLRGQEPALTKLADHVYGNPERPVRSR